MTIWEEVRHGRLAEVVPRLHQGEIVRRLLGSFGISKSLDSQVFGASRLVCVNCDGVSSHDQPRTAIPDIVLARAGAYNVILRILVVLSHAPAEKKRLQLSVQIGALSRLTDLQRPANISFVTDPGP